MNWIFFAIVAIITVSVSDIFRKLAASLHDPFLTNLLFQVASVTTAMIAYLLFSRKIVGNMRDISFALVGGALISLFSLFSFKALSSGPGVSVVLPVIRIGGVVLVFILGIVLLREKMTTQTIFGMLFSVLGLYLLFTS